MYYYYLINVLFNYHLSLELSTCKTLFFLSNCFYLYFYFKLFVLSASESKNYLKF